MKLIVFLLTILILSFPLASAQTVLQPGTTRFTVRSIYIYFLQIPYGDLDYLNILWDAKYSEDPQGDIGVVCYLNCPELPNCATSQNCSYLGPTGKKACTIIGPSYVYASGKRIENYRDYNVNNITCKFWNPQFPDITAGYVNVTFRPIDFDLSVLPASGTVGKQFNLPISVKNLGLLTDDYRISVTSTSEHVHIEGGENVISSLRTNETDIAQAKITILSTIQPTTLKVKATSEISKSYAEKEITIKGGNASLPDFGILGIIQIMLVAIVLRKFLNPS